MHVVISIYVLFECFVNHLMLLHVTRSFSQLAWNIPKCKNIVSPSSAAFVGEGTLFKWCPWTVVE